MKFSILEVISENDLVLKSEKEMSDVVVWFMTSSPWNTPGEIVTNFADTAIKFSWSYTNK